VVSGSNSDDVAVTNIQRVAQDFQVLIDLFSEFFRSFDTASTPTTYPYSSQPRFVTCRVHACAP
jgi:hypothetical protein